MKRILIVVVLVVAAAILGLWRTSGGVRQSLSRVVGASGEQSQGDAREEIRKSFELQPGARIDVMGINGKVDIQTSDTKTAEVYVLRTAGGREGLSRREVTIEQTSAGLVIKGRQVGHGFWEHLFGTKAAEDVTIKAPRQIALGLKGINGRVTGGDIDGALQAKAINGPLHIGQVIESAEISGVNGNIVVMLNRLEDHGAHLSKINGNVEIRLPAAMNASLVVKHLNGTLLSEIPGTNVDGENDRSNYSVRIGVGGAPITLSKINGSVRLTPSISNSATLAEKDSRKIKTEGNALP